MQKRHMPREGFRILGAADRIRYRSEDYIQANAPAEDEPEPGSGPGSRVATEWSAKRTLHYHRRLPKPQSPGTDTDGGHDAGGDLAL